MLVYDITSEKSFDNIKNWIRNIEEVLFCLAHKKLGTWDSYVFHSPQHATPDVERMILGNKCDMNDRRQVSKDRGESVSNKLH